MNYYVDALKNYVNFSGRASRKQYWMFVLFNFIISFVIGFVAGLILGNAGVFVGYVYVLAVLVPGIAIGVRRLHDIGKSGLWYLLCLIPCVGAIILIVFFCMKGEEDSNQYGDVPME